MSQRHVSPLRYPGGKASLAGFLEDVIDLNDLRGCLYFEAYAGGAGAALTLLERNVVDQIHINDADPRVYAFWKTVINETERFVDRVLTVPLSIDEWLSQRDICSKPNAHSTFDIGFSAFYMNRCNRSGVLTGAGPIGGISQTGKWKVHARFNREALAQRILNVGEKRERIQLSGTDAIEFLKRALPPGKARRSVFVYLDPPYVNNGQRLYLNAYGSGDHANVSRYLAAQNVLCWLMSYDDTDLVRKLYRQHQILRLPIRYSLQKKKSASELVIAPAVLLLPRSVTVHGIRSAFSQPAEAL